MEIIANSEHNQIKFDSLSMNNSINNNFDYSQFYKHQQISQNNTQTSPYNYHQPVIGQQRETLEVESHQPSYHTTSSSSIRLQELSSSIPISTNSGSVVPLFHGQQQGAQQQTYTQAQYDPYTVPADGNNHQIQDAYKQTHPQMTISTTVGGPIMQTVMTPQGPLPVYPQKPVNTPISAYPIDYNHYPDLTTMVNSNANISVPLVEAQFVDHKVCRLCGKKITRDMSRHMRTHQSESRFRCVFPRDQCIHKLGKFNRPYDFKKHLLNRHFQFDNPSIKKLHNLSDKLDHWGTCPCGYRSLGRHWLDFHVLVNDDDNRCPFVEVPVSSSPRDRCKTVG